MAKREFDGQVMVNGARQEHKPILHIRSTRGFYAYLAEETSLFILLFSPNWLGNVEVDVFRRLCHSPFDYHGCVSQEKLLISSTRLPASLYWSLRPDSRCCRIEYHYQHYLALAVHHNCYSAAKVTKVTKLTMAIIARSGWSTARVAPQTVKAQRHEITREMTSKPLWANTYYVH